MQFLRSFIKNFVFLFLKNLGKIFFVALVAIVFLVFLFPLSEISDFVSQNVSKMTNNQYYLEFETLKINLLADLGIKLGDVYVETPQTSPLTIKELIALPSVSALLYGKPQGRFKLKGLFKGDMELELSKHKEDNSGEKKIERNLIAIEASRLDLQELRKFLVLPFNFSGSLSLSSKIIANLAMQEPPEIQDLQITIKNFEMPQSTVEQPGGIPIEIPGIKLSELILKARYADNKLLISEIKLGKDSDEVLGTIKGQLQFMPLLQGHSMPTLNQYDMSLDLKMKKSFYDKIYLTLTVLNAGSYFSTISGGYQFKSKISGFGTNSIPRFDSLK